MMPIPKPRGYEEKDEFLKRCMADPVMQREYPEAPQRTAICNNAWSKSRSVELRRIERTVIICRAIINKYNSLFDR